MATDITTYGSTEQPLDDDDDRDPEFSSRDPPFTEEPPVAEPVNYTEKAQEAAVAVVGAWDYLSGDDYNVVLAAVGFVMTIAGVSWACASVHAMIAMMENAGVYGLWWFYNTMWISTLIMVIIDAGVVVVEWNLQIKDNKRQKFCIMCMNNFPVVFQKWWMFYSATWVVVYLVLVFLVLLTACMVAVYFMMRIIKDLCNGDNTAHSGDAYTFFQLLGLLDFTAIDFDSVEAGQFCNGDTKYVHRTKFVLIGVGMAMVGQLIVACTVVEQRIRLFFGRELALMAPAEE